MRIGQIFFSFLFLLVSVTVYSQEFEVVLNVSDEANSQSLTIGVHPDGNTNETYLDDVAPPPSFYGTFDARIRVSGEDYLKKILNNSVDEKTFPVITQLGAGQSQIQITWDNSGLAELGSFRITDDVNSANMVNVSSFSVANDGGGEPRRVFIYVTPAAPASPELSVNPPSLDFGNIQVGTNSNPQSYTVSGSDLTSNVSINAPSGYQVSTSSGSGYQNSLSIAPSGGSVNQTIYVQFSPTAAQSYSGNVSNESSGLTQNVSVSGTGVEPQLSVSPTSLSFGNVQVGTNSSPQSYTVTGSNLTSNVSISAPSGYQVSTSSGSGYQNSINISPSNGSVNQTVYVRFAPPSAQSYIGNVSNTSSGLTRNVSVSGTGVEPQLSVSPTSLSFGNVQVGSNSTQSYTVTGSNLTSNISINAPSGYQVSTSSGSGYQNSISISPSNGSVNQTVYVRFSPPAAQSYSGNVSNESSGLTRNVSVSGTGVTPSLNVDPTSLSFGNVQVGSNLTQSYTVTGSNLTSNISINAPSGYQVSTSSGSGYQSNISISPSNGSVNQTVYVRFSPTAAQSYSGNVSNESSGLTRNVSVSGTGTPPPPELSVSPTSLSFGNIQVGSNSTQSYTVTGSNLTSNVSISAPSGYQVSTSSGGGYQNSISISPSNGSINQTVYVRFSPTAAQSYSGNVSNESSGLTRNVSVSGTGVTPSLNVDPTSLSFGNVQVGTNSSPQSYTVSGSNLTSNVSINAHSGYQVSTNQTSGYQDNISISPSNGSVNQTIYVRFSPTATQSYSGDVSNASSGLTRNVSVSGTGVEPQLSVSPTSLSFGNVQVGTSSSPQSYTVTGSNLTSNVSISAPSGYQVSTSSGSGYQNSINISPSNGSVNQTIYVRFSPTAAQSYSGNVSNASSGATTRNVSVSGTGTPPPPELSVSPTSLSFGNVQVNTNSSPQSYTVTGSNLTSNVTISAPSGYQVSTSSGSGYQSNISISPSNGSVNQTVYVRFSPTAAQSYSGNVSNESSGLTRNVSVSGTGVIPQLSVNPTSLSFGNVQVGTNSSPQSYTVTGSNLTSNVSINAPSGYQVSTSSGSGYQSNISISPSNGSVNQTVYVRFSPTAAQSYSGNVSNESSGLTRNVNVSGTGTPPPPELSVSPTSLSFGNIQVGSNSTQSYTVTGSNLTSNVSISAPSGYQVSTSSGSGYQSSINISPSNGSVNQTVYVRFSPAAAQSYSGNVSNESSGLTRNVSVSGTGITPSLNVDPISLSFGNVQVGTNSSPQSYMVTGSNLTSNVSISAPSGYQVSTSSGSGYQSNINISPSNGSVNQTVYVRFSPTAAQSYSGNVSNESSGLTRNVSVSGTGVVPDLSVSPASLSFGNVQVGTNSTQSYTVTGSNLTSNVSISAPNGYQVSTSSGSGFQSSISISPSNGSINQTVYVRFSPTAAQSYSGNVSNESSGLTRNVSVNGTGIVPELSVSPTSLSFGDIQVGTNSTQSYTVTGSNLTSNVTVTAPSGYQVSTNQTSGFQNNISITPSNGNVNQTVYVRFAPTQTQSYSGNVSNESSGLTRNVSVSGTGVVPELSVSPTSLSFGDIQVGTNSTQSYTVMGSNLTSSVTVTAPSGYQVSTNQTSGFQNSISISPSDGSVNQIVYVRFAPTQVQSYSGNVSNASSGLVQNVSVSGAGVVPELIVNPSSLSFGNVELGTNSTQSYDVTGSNLTTNVAITAPSGYQISTNQTSGYQNNISISPNNGNINQTIYVRFSPSQAQSFSGDVSNASSGLTRNVSVSGTGVRLPEVTTGDPTNIRDVSATLNGTVTDIGQPPLSEHGFVWSTTQNPTVDNNKENLGVKTSTGPISTDITGLSAGTQYYVRAYAISGSGVVYGNQISFTTTVPTKLVFSQQPSSTQAGQSITPAVEIQVLDQSDNLATGYSGNVTIAIGTNPGTATLEGTTTKAAVNGVVTFNDLKISKSGIGYTLQVTATNLTPATSNAFDITAGPATKLIFEAEPSNTQAGEVITPAVIVHAVDQFENIVTGYTGNITIAIGTNPGDASLEGTIVKAAVNGVVTFNDLKINKTGTGYTLQAAASNLISAASAAFNITAGPAVKLVFEQQPITTQAGQSITPPVVIHALDQFDNVATGYSGSVTIALSPNSENVALDGAKIKAAVNGVVTFNDLKINTAGTGYTLQVTAANLTSATSTAFNITAGAASKLIFSVEPTNTQAGSVITPAVIVHAVDQFDNLVSGYSGSVTIILSPNPDNVVLDGTKVKAAVNGVVTFNDLKINTAGTGYTFQVTAANLTSATSAAFNVTAGPATKLIFEVEPSNTQAGSVITPAVIVHAVDQFDNLVSGYSGSVTIALSPNPDNVALDGTKVRAAVNGVVTFNDLKINKTGTGYTLQVTAVNLTSATSAAFNITAGAAMKLVFDVQPSATQAGQSITPAVVVHALDQFDNVASGYSGSVTIALSPNPGNITLDGTKVKAAVNGVVTFNDLKINKTGTGYTFQVTAANLTSATSAAFNITAGPAIKLVFDSQPSNTQAGQPITPAVEIHVLDQFDNIVTGYSGNVTMAIGTNPGSATLGGTTVRPVSNGVASFNDLKINIVGTDYTLMATAANLIGATSEPFTITAGPAAKLIFEEEPSNTVAGEIITPAVVVHAVDQFDNLANTFAGTVTLTIANNPGNATLQGTTAIAAAEGIATFSNLKINNAAKGYTLQSTAPNVQSVPSSAFDIFPSDPAIIVKVSGDNQDGLINTVLEAPLIVKVTDEFNNPVGGITVTFEITDYPETASGQELENTTDETDAEGNAQTILIMGNTDGTYRVTASATDLNDVLFIATISTVRISGTVTEAGTGIADVDVVLTWEGFTQPTRTSETGSYLIPGIPRGATNIAITASKTGYLFEPEEHIIDGPVVNHITDINFITLPPFAPELVSPENDIVELPATVTIEWSETERTDHYNIQVATISDFTSGIFADVDTILSITYQLENLQYGQTYYWRVRSVNPSGYGEWSEVWNFTIVPTVTHLINIRVGWNMISSYVEPLENSIDSMFESIGDNLVIAKDGAGNAFIPLHGIDQIKSWNSNNGYQIYLYPDNDQLEVYGIEIKPEKVPIELQLGWNIAGYLRTSTMHVQDAFSTIDDELIIIKNNAGQVYIPPGVVGPDMILTIPDGSIIPGEGYQMYLSTNGTLIYPANGGTTSQQHVSKDAGTQRKQSGTVAQPTKYIVEGKTGNNATLIVESDLLTGGNEIAAFTESGALVGSGVTDANHTAVVTVWGEDELSDEKQTGAGIHENLYLKMWCFEREKESDVIITSIKNILVASDSINQLLYKPDAVYHVLIDIDNQIPEEYVLHQNYPNPFNPTTTIEYAIKEDTYVVLEVFNILGQHIETLVQEEQTAGRYKVMFNGSRLPSGTYFYRLHTHEFTNNKRFILLK